MIKLMEMDYREDLAVLWSGEKLLRGRRASVWTLEHIVTLEVFNQNIRQRRGVSFLPNVGFCVTW